MNEIKIISNPSFAYVENEVNCLLKKGWYILSTSIAATQTNVWYVVFLRK